VKRPNAIHPTLSLLFPLPHQIGTVVPYVELTNAATGDTETLASSGFGPKLIIVYRGQFCPFCQGTLAAVQSKLEKLTAAGFDVVAVSADPADVSKGYATKHGLTFTLLSGLTETHIRALGLYLSDPTDYIPQTHRFSEPAYIVLNEDSTIKYIDVSSHPMGGRVNVDNLLAGYAWAKEEEKSRPDFARVVWGGK